MDNNILNGDLNEKAKAKNPSKDYHYKLQDCECELILGF